MTRLNSVCDGHDHTPGLPDADLRAHVLAVAVEAAENELRTHGYPYPERALEALHVAMEDGLDESTAWTTSETEHADSMSGTIPFYDLTTTNGSWRGTTGRTSTRLR